LNPYWPALKLQNQQREGNRSEDFRVEFVSGNDRFTYNPSSADEFAKYKIGSQWKLTVNGLGSVVNTERAE
jgi:hypothetical protein